MTNDYLPRLEKLEYRKQVKRALLELLVVALTGGVFILLCIALVNQPK